MRTAILVSSIVLLAASAGAQTYDGSWSGTTGQGKAITFTVVANKLTVIEFGGNVSGSSCSGSFTTKTTYTTPRSFSTPSFTLTGGSSSPGATSWTLSGTFATTAAVSGNISFTSHAIPGITCTASGASTWSATRSGGEPPPPPATLAGVFAAVGSLQGNGAFFKTSVQLHNPGTSAIAGKLVFHRAGAGGTDADPSLSYSLAARQTITYDDLLPAMGQSGLGSLDLVTTQGSAPLTTFRIFSDAGALGTSGMSIDPIAPNDALKSGQTGVLLAPADLMRFRLNIGIRTLSAGVSMQITVRDVTGAIRHTATKTLPATYFIQESAANFLGVTPSPGDSIDFAINSGSAIIYGAVTDNTTQDPTLNYAKSIF